MTVFVSSHLLAEIELMCDRVAIIHKGRVLQSGAVHELISSQREMEFRVGDVAAARQVFAQRSLTPRIDGDRLFVSMEEEDAPPVVAALAEAGVALFHAQRKVQTLEETFLEATGGETVG